ncbi:hypothetical protein DB30_00249 [Enhygromyxa salina]|uniref:GMT-like wHTH domain-containing protein n=2 Tax=Enhygromyxa salina TaxID=215803 RepID=A0A0C1ZM48_9BACT|nr:hypothetical protein DB30_00249 [Enhygromyxa salina]
MLGYDPRNDIAINTQQVFDFSEDSSLAIMSALANELPRRLHTPENDGVRFWDFFDGICNESPATSEQVRSVLRQLSLDREVEIHDPDKGRRRPGVKIHNNDRIHLPRQLTFDMGKSRAD